MKFTRYNIVQFCLANFLLIVTLSPILRTPYGIDDIYDSVWPYIRESNGTSLWLDINNWINFFKFDHGKFNPFGNFAAAITFELFDTRMSFKIAQLISTILMFNLLAYLAFVISGRFRLLVLTLLATSILVSFRIEFDGILQYALHQKISNSIIFLCLIFAFKSIYRKDDSNFNFVLCLIFFILSFLTYETSFTLGFIVLISRLRYFAKSYSKNLVFIITFIVMFIFKLYIYFNRSVKNFEAYSTNGDLTEIFILYLKFLFSSLPFSNNLVELSFSNLSSLDLYYILAIFIISLFVFYRILYISTYNFIPNYSENLVIVLSVGSALFFISPILFALSTGYSKSNSWGEGYHFTTLTTAGLIFIFTYFLSRINLSSKLILLCFVSVYSFNFSNNLGVSASDKVWSTSAKLVGYPREAFSSALKNGILTDAKDPFSILLLPSLPWAENSVLKIESNNSNLLFVNSWWRFADKPPSLPEVCSEIATICKISKPQDVLLVSADSYNRSYAAFFNSNMFYVPKEYDKRGLLSEVDFKIDAATSNARVMFTSGNSCSNFNEIVQETNTNFKVYRDLDFDIPTYNIVSDDLFWVRRFKFEKCY
jgi:hypothetical protein